MSPGAFVAVFIASEAFTLAICSVGAIVAMGMLLKDIKAKREGSVSGG